MLKQPSWGVGGEGEEEPGRKQRIHSLQNKLEKIKEPASAEEGLSRPVLPKCLKELLEQLQLLRCPVRAERAELGSGKAHDCWQDSAEEVGFTHIGVNKKSSQLGRKWNNPQVVQQIQWKTQERSVSAEKAGSAQTGKKNEYHEGKPCSNSSGGLVACCILYLVLL